MNLIKWFIVAVGLLLSAGLAQAQAIYATVTATVTDPNSHPLAGAQYTITLLDPTGRQITSATTPNGSIVSTGVTPGVLDANGAFSVNLLETNTLSRPTGTQWRITISPPPLSTQAYILTYQPPWTINYSTAITANVDLTSQLSSLTAPINFINLQTGQNTLLTAGGNISGTLMSGYVPLATGTNTLGNSTTSFVNGGYVMHGTATNNASPCFQFYADHHSTSLASFQINCNGEVYDPLTGTVFSDAAGNMNVAAALNSEANIEDNGNGGAVFLDSNFGYTNATPGCDGLIGICVYNGTTTYFSVDNVGNEKAASIVDSGLTPGTSPICPNGSGGAFTTSGCAGGSATGAVLLAPSGSQTIAQVGNNQLSINTTSSGEYSPINLEETIWNYGPGHDCGNSTTACDGWSGMRGQVFNISNSQRGINQINSVVMDNNAIGDFAHIYAYLQPYGGQTAASDEGVQAWVEQLHQKGAYTALVSGSPATGATTITTTGFGCTYGYCITQSGHDTWTDGGQIFDKSQPVSTATTGTQGNSMGGISYTITGGTVPVSTAWGNIVASSCTPNGNGQWQAYVSTTCTVTLGTSPASPGHFATGANACLVGPFKENVAITAVTTGSTTDSVTFSTRYAWNSTSITELMMQGSDCGDSFVASGTGTTAWPYGANNWPISYFIVGATNSTTLIFANCLTGGCGVNGVMPPTATPITIYPSAEIIGTNGTFGSANLGTNQMALANGDTLVGAPTSQYLGVGLRLAMGQTTPFNSNISGGIDVQDDGPFQEAYAYYATNNGANGVAQQMLLAEGSYQDDLHFGFAPTRTILFVQNGASQYNIYQNDVSGSGAIISVNPTTNVFDFTSPYTATLEADKVAFTAGAIDNTTIGSTTPDTGAFTTLSSTGALKVGAAGTATQMTISAVAVSALPAASTVPPVTTGGATAYTIMYVKDGSTTTDCTTGGGSDLNSCYSNGSAWVNGPNL